MTTALAGMASSIPNENGATRSPGHNEIVSKYCTENESPQELSIYSYLARPESVHHDPSETLPEHSVPADVAKNLVLDVLQEDMNPRLNMAGWLTTLMEPEGEEIIMKGLHLNIIDTVQYPSASKMAQRCVHMLASLWNAPEGFIGTETVGSTEACYLGALAAKKNWQQRRRNEGHPTDKPNMVFGANAQIAWQKACSYFDIEPRMVNLREGQLVIDPGEVPSLIDENTIAVAVMVGSTYTGAYEDVSKINDVLEEALSSRGFEIPIHVDAAGGGLIAPLFDYLGSQSTHMTMNFSRPGAYAAAQYYNFVRLGKEGYRRIFANLFKTYDYLVDQLNATGHFEILSPGDLPVVAFRIRPELNKDYDEYDVMDRLKEHRFMLPAYQMAPKASQIKLLRACIRPGFDMEMAEDLAACLQEVISWLDKHGGGHKREEKGEARGGGDDGDVQQHGVC